MPFYLHLSKIQNTHVILIVSKIKSMDKGMNLIDGIVILLSVTLIALGGCVIGGWYAHNAYIVQIATNFSPMQFNTALGLVLFGVGILCSERFSLVSKICSYYLIAVGFLTVIEYLSKVNLGIDELFIKSFMSTTIFPGRPAPNTALCLLLAGFALLLLTSKISSASKIQLGTTLSLLVGAIGFVAIIGYLTNIPTAFGWGDLTQMSIHTAIAFVLMSATLLICYWQKFQKGDLDKNKFIAICTFVLGIISFIIFWQELVKSEHKKIELAIQREAGFTKNEFIQEFGTTITAIRRMQDRLLDTNGYSFSTWEKDVKNYYMGSPALLFFAIADANNQLVKQIPRTEAIGNILQSELQECASQVPKNNETENIWFTPIGLHNMCVGYHIGSNGNLFSIFDLNEVLDAIRLDNTKDNYSIQLLKDNDIIYFYYNNASLLLQKEWAYTIPFRFHGLELKLVMWPNAHVIQQYSTWIPTIGLIFGILITSLLLSVIYLYGIMKTKQKSLMEAEEKTSTIINKSREAFVAINKTGQIIDWNEQAEITFGWSKSEILGKQIDKTIIPFKHRVSHKKGLRHYFKTGEGPLLNKRMELTALRRNGEEFPIELSVTPLQFDDEVIFSAFLYDITARKNFEDQQAMLYAIMQFSDDAIIGLNLQGIILSWNKGAEKIYGYSAEDTIGKSIGLIYPPERGEEFILLSYKLQMGEKMKSMETFHMTKNGTIIPVSTTISPINNSKNEMIGISTTTRDISLQKEMDEKLKLKNIELENANLAKDRFFASMSHELRTPLNAIIGFTGTLLMQLPGPLNNDQRKQLQTVQHGAKHLLSLINDILDLAKIESGKIELSYEDIECHEVINYILSFLEGMAKAKNIEFSATMPDEKIYVRSDRRSLAQILINLTNNAIKFTERGFVNIQLNIKRIEDHDYVVIAIEDTGVGIKNEDKKKLFQAFEKLDTPGKFAEGTGLGLHLCKKLAKMLKIKITFESEFGKGTIFTISLPLLRVDEKDEALLSNESALL